MSMMKSLTIGGLTREIPSKTSDLTNDSGFVDAAGAAAAAPVQSVNSKTGAVVLDSSDVGLGNVDNVQQYSASNPPPYPVTSVNSKTGAVVLGAADVGAATEQDIADAIIQVLPVDSASGSIASFPDGYPAPVEALSVTITPVQDLHGQTSPYPAGGGKNKSPLENIDGLGWSSQSASSLLTAINALPAGTYTISCKDKITAVTGTGTWQFGFYLSGHSNVDLRETVYTDPQINTVHTLEKTFTIGAEDVGLYTNLYAYGCGYAGVGAKGTANLYEIQLEQNSVATAYAPYSNICPITGWSEAKVTDDPKYGGDIYWNQLAEISGSTEIKNDVTFTNNGDGSWTVSGTNSSAGVTQKRLTARMPIALNHIYICTGAPSSSSANTYCLSFWANNDNTQVVPRDVGYGSVFKITTQYANMNLAVFINVLSGVSVPNAKFIPQVYDVTEMFGETVANYIYTLEQGEPGAGVAYFRNLFPKTYYELNAGETTCVSAVNGDPYRQITIDLSGTRYGGTLDVKTGVLTITEASTELKNLPWEKGLANNPNGTYFYINSTTVPYIGWSTVDKTKCLCNALKPSDTGGVENSPANSFWWNNASTGWRIIYGLPNGGSNVSDLTSFLTNNNVILVAPLATPLSVQLTPAELSTLLGQNNVWANCGDVSVSYRADIQRYIEKKLS